MKSLKKKVCVSVLLEELFEVVDEDGVESRIKRERDRGRRGCDSHRLKASDSAFTAVQGILLQREDRPRKCRNARGISHSEREHFLYQMHTLDARTARSLTPTEKVDQGTTTELETENTFGVDEYSESDLNFLDFQVEQDDRETQTFSVTADVGVSTSFVSKSSDGKGRGCSGESRAGAMHSDGDVRIEGGRAPSSKCGVGGSGLGELDSRILRDLEQNNKCFLVARCANSTNLTGKSHESTQSDVGGAKAVVSDGGPLSVREDKSAEWGERTLEELFSFAKARRSVNALKRSGKVIQGHGASKERAKAGHAIQHRGFSDSRISQCKVNGLSPWQEQLRGCIKVSQSAVIQRVVCDMMVKTFIKAHYEELFCYTLSMPSDIEIFRDLVIPASAAHAQVESLTFIENISGDDGAVAPLPLESQYSQSCSHLLALTNDSGSTNATEVGSTDTVVVESGKTEEKNSGEVSVEVEPERAMEEDTNATAEEGAKQLEKEGTEVANSTPEEAVSVTAEPEAAAEGAAERKESERKVESWVEGSLREQLDERAMFEALAPKIMEELRLLEMKFDPNRYVDKAINTEALPAGEDEDVAIQWELEIEIQSDGLTEYSLGRREVYKDCTGTQIVETLERASNGSLLVICQAPREGFAGSGSEASSACDLQQSSCRGDGSRTVYRGSVTHSLPRCAEKRPRRTDRR